MRSYLSLVPISARIHRRQSRMTRLCIILAVFLVVTLFSIGDMTFSSEKEAMLDKHGNYHIMLQNVPEEDAERIGGRSDVTVAAWCDEINPDADKDYGIDGKCTVLYGVESSYITDIRNYLAEGNFPQNDKEILLSKDAEALLGIKVGDHTTLHTPQGDLDYTVSGFCKDDTDFNNSIDGCCVYMNMDAFQKVRDWNEEEVNQNYYIRFGEDANLKKTIAAVKEEYGLTEENVEENVAVLGFSGASSRESIKNTYPLFVITFLLILLSGVLMISGCINSNVAQRTSFFGMMRCIGASKQQIIRYVRLEALGWCVTSIPIGCAFGVVTTWITCAILRLMVKGEWAYMPHFDISGLGIVGGIAVGLVTVFLAAYSPAKRAAKVSPVSAVSGNAGTVKNVKHAANTRLFKIETSLGIHHAVSDKKNLILIAGSFALTIVLFLIFSACLDLVYRLFPSERDFTPDISIVSQENSNSIDQNLVSEILAIPGVEQAFGTMYSINLPVEINGNKSTIDLISYGEFMLDSTKECIASGDLSKVYGDSNDVLTIYGQEKHLAVGDKIKIGQNELEIACVASEGIGSMSGSVVVVCSEETFARLTGEQGYMMVNAILGKDATETAVNKIRDLAEGNEFADRREEDDALSGTYWVLRVAVYAFLAIIFLITVLNIMNSISMSVSARIKQYGAMRAVGMESRQITKMITAEAVTYAVCGMIVGDVFGVLLHYLFYEKAILSHFGGTWHIPVILLAIILLMVSASCIVAVYSPSKRIRNMAITDTINEL